MPASTRLLQKLKETWGEEVTQDLVTWVSEAQTVNRAELRELADFYFARFGDRLEERIALSEARLETKFAAMLDERIHGVRLEVARLEGRLDAGLAGINGRLDTALADINGRLDAGLAGINGRVDASLASHRAEVVSQMRDQMKWMFVFWIGTLVPLAGLIVALGKEWL